MNTLNMIHIGLSIGTFLALAATIAVLSWNVSTTHDAPAQQIVEHFDHGEMLAEIDTLMTETAALFKSDDHLWIEVDSADNDVAELRDRIDHMQMQLDIAHDIITEVHETNGQLQMQIIMMATQTDRAGPAEQRTERRHLCPITDK